MYAIIENSGCEFAAFFEDIPGDPAIPLGVQYRLTTEDGQVVIDWTAADTEIVTDETGITAARVLIDVPGSANAMRDKSNTRQVMELIVVSGKDHPREKSEVFTYLVRRARSRI